MDAVKFNFLQTLEIWVSLSNTSNETNNRPHYLSLRLLKFPDIVKLISAMNVS